MIKLLLLIGAVVVIVSFSSFDVKKVEAQPSPLLKQYTNFYRMTTDASASNPFVVTLLKTPVDQPLIMVWKNGLKQWQGIDFYRFGSQPKRFGFGLGSAGDSVEVMYWSQE